MRRRTFLGAMAASAIGGPALAQSPRMQTFLPPGVAPKTKGPVVFLDYDKDEIDYSYDQAPWAPNAGEITKRNAQKSEAALKRLGQPSRVAYGTKDIEKIDIYRTKAANAPVRSEEHTSELQSH